MIQWHERETSADHNRIDPSNGVDHWSVFLVVDAERLERALKAMHQVNGERKHSDEVDGHQPELLESNIDPAVDVLDGFVMARVSDHGELIGKAHFDPEVTHVDAEEGKDQDSQQGHVFGRPRGTCDFAGLIIGAFGFAIVQPEDDPLDGMKDDKGVEAYRNHLDDDVVRHESRVDIEGAAAIVG